ncbi:hypothetical protein PENTCL1PPCAC_1720, partial [Pristionchus entomophagus]
HSLHSTQHAEAHRLVRHCRRRLRSVRRVAGSVLLSLPPGDVRSSSDPRGFSGRSPRRRPRPPPGCPRCTHCRSPCTRRCSRSRACSGTGVPRSHPRRPRPGLRRPDPPPSRSLPRPRSHPPRRCPVRSPRSRSSRGHPRQALDASSLALDLLVSVQIRKIFVY